MTSLEIVRLNSLSDINALKFFQCCRDIIRDSIVNDTHVYAAVVMDDSVSHTFQCSPGNFGMLVLEVLCQLVGVLRNLNQAEHHRILKHLILFQIFLIKILGVRDDEEQVGQKFPSRSLKRRVYTHFRPEHNSF